MKVTQPVTTNATPIAEKSFSKPEAKRPSKVEAHPEKNPGSDVQISENARLAQNALELIKSYPDSSQEKIMALKKSIREGTYRIPSDVLADKILDEHLSTDFGKNNL